MVPLRYGWSRAAYPANQLTFAPKPDCKGGYPIDPAVIGWRFLIYHSGFGNFISFTLQSADMETEFCGCKSASGLIAEIRSPLPSSAPDGRIFSRTRPLTT